MSPLARRLAAFGLVLASSCAPARRGEPLAAPLVDSSLQRGQELFMRNCHKCHPGGEAGLGPSLNDKPLPRFLIRFQVRRGLGAMPDFSEEQISDEELEQLADFLAEYRSHG